MFGLHRKQKRLRILSDAKEQAFIHGYITGQLDRQGTNPLELAFKQIDCVLQRAIEKGEL